MENKMMNITNLSTVNEQAVKASMATLFKVASKIYHQKVSVDAEFLNIWFMLAKEDVEKHVFTWEEFIVALKESFKTSSYFPVYANIYKSLKKEPLTVLEIRHQQSALLEERLERERNA